jgi:hypothetical protein
MSVYRDTNADVTFEHPHPGPLVATVYRDSVQIFQSLPLTPTAGRFTITLSYVETQYDGKLDIKWSNDTDFVRWTSVEVVTPLVPLSRLRTLFADTNWTDSELMELEHSVRIFIQSYTGQTFGYQVGSISVRGTGEERVSLPKRLISLTNVNGGVSSFFAVGHDGWSLYVGNKNLLDIKEAPPEDYLDYVTHGVIVVPDTYWKQFRRGAVYTLTGEWGYYSVPDDIQEAALLLANDFGCGDSLYRDRYLEMIKSSDWNMTFNTGAWQGTGNKRADDLLEPYRRQGMVII